MSFNLERALEELVFSAVDYKTFLDRIISYIFFSGLKVFQQYSSDHFGHGLSLLGSAQQGSGGLILLTPLPLLKDPTSPIPLLSTHELRYRRLDFVVKLWLASQSEDLKLPISVGAYRPDPLGLGLQTLFEELLRPSVSRIKKVLLYGGSFFDIQKAETFPGSVSFRIPLVVWNSGNSEETLCSRLYTSIQKRFSFRSWSQQLFSFIELNKTPVYRVEVGGLDRSPLDYAAAMLPEINVRYPSHWKIQHVPCLTAHYPDYSVLREKLQRCTDLNSSRNPLYYIDIHDGELVCNFLVSPKDMEHFIEKAKPWRPFNIELSGHSYSGKGITIPGVVSTFAFSEVFLSMPPRRLDRHQIISWTQKLRNWIINFKISN